MKRVRRWWVFIVIAVWALTATVSADGTIRYMTFFPEEIEHQVVAAFEASHPDISVQMEPAGFGDLFEQLRIMLVGGVAPDVVSLNYEQYMSFAASGALLDVNRMMARDDFDVDQYFPSVFDLFTVDGAQFGLPATFSDVVVFYNVDLYEAAGLAQPGDDWHWNDLIESSKRLTRDFSGDGAMDQFGYVTGWWPLYVWLGGGDIIDETGTRVLIDSPEAAYGLQEMVDTWLVHGIAPSPDELAAKGDWDRWEEGTLAHFPIGPWGLEPFQDTPFDWNATHHPGIAQQATFLFSNPLAITAQTSNEDAAWTFMQFATGPEGTAIRQAAGYEISPVRSVAQDFGEGLNRPKNMHTFLDATVYAKSPPGIAEWDQVHAAAETVLNQLRNGEIPATTAVANAAIVMQAILDQTAQ